MFRWLEGGLTYPHPHYVLTYPGKGVAQKDNAIVLKRIMLVSVSLLKTPPHKVNFKTLLKSRLIFATLVIKKINAAQGKFKQYSELSTHSFVPSS